MCCWRDSRPSASLLRRRSRLSPCSCAATRRLRSPAPTSAWTGAGPPPRLSPMRAPVLLAALLACSSCSVIEQPSGMIPRWTLAWKDVVTADDRERLRDWRTTFVAAVNAARAAHSAEVTREETLLDPDAAIAGPALPEGMFRCRVIKLGAKQ